MGSNAWNYRIRELAEPVRTHLGNVEVSLNPNAVPDKRSYRVDFGVYAKLAPDHTPQMTLSTAVADLADGLRDARFGDADFRNSNYIRLKVLNDLRSMERLDEHLHWKIA